MSLIIQIIRQIAKRWYLWVFIPLFTASIIFYLTGKSPKKYESNGTLYLNLPTNNGLSITNEGYKQHEISAYIQDLIQLTNSSKAMEYVRLSVLKDYLKQENDLFNIPNDQFPWTDSTAVIERVDSLIQQNKMLDVYEPLDAKMTIFFRDNGMTNESIKSLFRIYREGSSNYLRLKVTTGNPYHSAYFGKKITEAMLHLNKDINQGKLMADQRLFEKLVEQAKKELDQKVANLERYKIRYNVINLPEHTKAIVNQMVQLEVQKAELVEMLASKQEGIIQLRNKLGVVDEIPVDLSKNALFIELQNKMRTLKSQSTVDSLDKEITLNEIQTSSQALDLLMEEYVSEVPIDIRKTRQELIQQYLNYQVEVEMTKQLIPIVDSEIDRIGEYARKFAPLESNIGTLEREITTAQETYLILVNKLNLAKTVAQATGVNELVLIDSPDVPLKPLSTKRKILVIMAFMLTFIIVVFLIAAIEFLDAGIWSAKDYIRIFETEPDVVFPKLPKDLNAGDEELNAYLHTIHAQRIKSIAYKVHSLTKDDHHEVVVLSALKGEGKHELLSGLALELGKLGYAVSASSNDGQMGEWQVMSSLNQGLPEIKISIIPPFSVYTDWEKTLVDQPIYINLLHAGRPVMKCDFKVLEEINSSKTIRVLNNVLSDYLEDSGSSVIKKRSIIRVWVKRILTLQFKAKTMELRA